MKTKPTFPILCKLQHLSKRFSALLLCCLLLSAGEVFSQPVTLDPEDCDPISIFPWTEGFEDNGLELPTCWEQQILNSYIWQWTIVPDSIGTPPNAHGGNYKARIYLNSAIMPIYRTRLVTPVFDLSQLNTPVLNFWYTQKAPLSIYYKNLSGGEWVLLKAIGGIPNWQEEFLLLPNKSTYYQIAFQAMFSGGNFEIQLDDISIMEFMDVELSAILAPVSGVYLSNSEPVKVLLKNNGGKPLTEFALQLELDGNHIVNEIFADTIPSLGQAEYTFDTPIDLSAVATYQIKVTAIAEEDMIPSNNSKTVTIRNFVYNTDATLSNLSVSEGELLPEFNSNIYNYTVNVEYGVEEIAITATPNNPNAIVTGTGTFSLEEGENIFTLTVTAEDGATELSYIITINRSVNVKDSNLSKIYLYPSPTTGQLSIVNCQLSINKVEIFDIYGRILSSHHLITSSSHHQIDISHLHPGVYFLKIATEKGEIMKKIIKQ